MTYAPRSLFERVERIVPPNAVIPVVVTLDDCATIAFLIELKRDEIRCAGASDAMLLKFDRMLEAIERGVLLVEMLAKGRGT